MKTLLILLLLVPSLSWGDESKKEKISLLCQSEDRSITDDVIILPLDGNFIGFHNGNLYEDTKVSESMIDLRRYSEYEGEKDLIAMVAINRTNGFYLFNLYETDGSVSFGYNGFCQKKDTVEKLF